MHTLEDINFNRKYAKNYFTKNADWLVHPENNGSTGRDQGCRCQTSTAHQAVNAGQAD